MVSLHTAFGHLQPDLCAAGRARGAVKISVAVFLAFLATAHVLRRADGFCLAPDADLLSGGLIAMHAGGPQRVGKAPVCRAAGHGDTLHRTVLTGAG